MLILHILFKTAVSRSLAVNVTAVIHYHNLDQACQIVPFLDFGIA